MVSISWERRADDSRVAVHPSNSRFSGRRRIPYVDSPSSHSSPPSSSTSFFVMHHKVKKAESEKAICAGWTASVCGSCPSELFQAGDGWRTDEPGGPRAVPTLIPQIFSQLLQQKKKQHKTTLSKRQQ